ncbi:MAG: class I SAM-dependent methyltransferase [Thermoleophilia bacterium]|nr:class I SAM-dependent methyltransferase [Thermoleophilia bacterium]
MIENNEIACLTNQRRCTLCGSNIVLFCDTDGKSYYRCADCSSILMDPLSLPSREEERRRYQEHNNDVEDRRYQEFVAPIVNEIQRNFNQEHAGLDFGAGPGPVVTKLLRDSGFTVELYDPLFWANPEALRTRYDYIACCEVIEHFHSPRKEFALLHSLLKPGGALYCMTEPYSEDIDFGKWYYKSDQSHVFFYTKDTFEWVRSHMRFSKLRIKGRLVQFYR